MSLTKFLSHILPENPTPTQTLPGADDIARVELPNGITILSRSNFNSPSVSIQGYIQAGSILDPDEKLGLANFTSAGLMRGAAGRDFQEIYNTLESAGASLALSCGTLSTSFGGKSLAEDLGLVLELLAQVLSEPEFPELQVERLRTQYLTALSLRAQDTAAMAALKFDSILFAGHPYSRPEDGFRETITAIGREDLIQFHKSAYGPKGMVITIVGGLETQEVIDRAADVLSKWENPEQQDLPTPAEAASLENVNREHVTIPGKSQADIVMGVLAPERKDADFLALAVGNDILGQFGLYGRLGESVRENAGLAYYVYSSLNAGIGPGAWYAAAGVDPTNIDQAVNLIEEEFKRITKKAVSEEEISDTQTNFIGRLPLGLESNSGVASAIIHLERYGLGLDYYRLYPNLVQAITREEVLGAVRKYLDVNKMAIATAGPER